MKIDLHCHTMKTKSGDAPTRDIDASSFKSILNNSNVKIAAITNHNVFNYNQYKEFVEEVKNDFQIWPGIELDVLSNSTNKNGNRKTGHVIIISNPEYVEEFNDEVNRIIGNVKADEVEISIEELLNFFSNLSDAIILPHYCKPHALDKESIDSILNGINEKYRFFYEPSNYRSLGILNNHNFPSLMGSDVKDWNEYSNYEKTELKLDVDSFEQFILLAKKDQGIVETLLNKKTCTKIDIHHRSKKKGVDQAEKEVVQFYDDINIIFGAKGTGKSDAIERIKEYYQSKNIEFSYYTPSNTEDEIESKLDVNPSERELSSFTFNDAREDFDEIMNWEDKPITQLKDFFDYERSKYVNKNKLKILDTMMDHNISDSRMKEEKKVYKYVKIIETNASKIDLVKYLGANESDALQALLLTLRDSVLSSLQNEWIDYESKNEANKTIDILKKSIEKKTETKTKPSRTGLFEYCNNRYGLMIAFQNIEKGFNYSFEPKYTFIGNLEKNKSLYITTKYRMLNKECKREEFTDKITDLRSAKKMIEDSYSHLFDNGLTERMGSLITFLIDHQITSLNKFLAVKKAFTLSSKKDAEEYHPSTGEATMIILQEKLDVDKSVYILDEPEKSLGNTYVNDIIVPKLTELAKRKKTVIVVTHNANIAVRTFPYTSVLKTYSDGVYETYVGNPFVNELISLSDSKHVLNWKTESLKILEGGEEAFEERGEIYGKRGY